MKSFNKSYKVNENGCPTADVNQGNALHNTGVTNHLTPIGNIVTNVRNLFSTHLGVVASVAEDGVSIKLNSSYFVSPSEIRKVLYNYEIMRGTCLASYIQQQGLSRISTVNLGQYYVVYFSPVDIAQAMPATEPEACECPYSEGLTYEADFDMISIIREDDEELEDTTKKKVNEIIDMDDKVKAAKMLDKLMSKEMHLPREYYFAGIKPSAENGKPSIGLRWKFDMRSGKDETTEIVKTLVKIYNTKDGVFVPPFDKDSMFNLPDDVKKLIENLLSSIGAKETDDECVYEFSDADKDKDDKDKDKDEDDSDKEDDGDDNDNNSDNEKDSDNKDDKSSDDLDDLLS